MNDKFPRLALLSTMAFLCASLQAQTLNPLLLGSAPRIDGDRRPAASPAARRPSGQQLMAAAQRRAESHITVKSRLRVRVDLLGQPLVGSGEYAQLHSSQGLLLRMELSIQAGGETTSIKQVCDGRCLWVHGQMGDAESLSRIDLLRVQRAIAETRDGHRLQDATTMLASGGLPRLLSQLTANFDFDRVAPHTAEVFQAPAWIATGVWKLSRLAAIEPAAVDADQVEYEKLPPHLPHRVEVHLGQSDLFPYKLVYQRWEPTDGQAQFQPAVTAEFFDVALGEPLDARQFVYQPSNLSVTDETDLYLQNLGVAQLQDAASTR